MTRPLRLRTRSALGLSALIAAALLGLAAPVAGAATYPAGGGSFSGGAQGWQVTEASCNLPAFCSADGGYDAGNGSPPGSIAANTDVTLNLVGLFESTVTVQSPDFTVTEDGAATLHLDRQFAPGSLVDLAAKTTYTVTLIDRDTGRKAVPLTESIDAAFGFTGKDAAVSIAAGHTYAISIETVTSSSVAGTVLLGGSTSTRFDNVALTVQGGGGGRGGSGAGGGVAGAGGGALTDQKLLATIQGSLVAPATLRGRRLFVKTRCPAGVGRACRVSLQGLLKKRRAATTRRVVRIAKGKAKRIVLRVRPAARGKLAARKRLLFKQTVKAGPARATAYKRLKLIRR